MLDLDTRFWGDILNRIGGPLTLRFLLQPVMSAFFAARDGVKDAQEGKLPYFWALKTHPEQRRELLRDGWKSVSKIFIFAIVLDFIYQWVVLRFIYIGEALFVAILLALIPYVLLRGTVNRFATHWRRTHAHSRPTS